MRLLIVITVQLMVVFTLWGQTQWELIKEKDGIRVYNKDEVGSLLKSYRGVMELQAGIQTVVDVITDIAQYKDWMPNITKSSLVQVENNLFIGYLVSESSWPVADRDGYYSYQVQCNESTSTCLITIDAIPDYKEEKKGKVRISKTEGFWKLSGLNDKKTKVIYEFFTDPGGTIPSWMVNTTISSNPYKTLKGLEAQCKLREKP